MPREWETTEELAKSLHGLEASGNAMCPETFHLREVEEELDIRLAPELVERLLRRARYKLEIPRFCDARTDEGERQQQNSRAAYDAA